MPRERLGPWGKWYASTEEDTAHYTDAQFRAWSKIFGRAVQNRGELPKLDPLKALVGADHVEFLIAQGRLVVRNNAVTIASWKKYQAPVDRTNADRQQRLRDRRRTTSVNGAEPVDKSLRNGSNGVTVTEVPTSTSISTKAENGSESPESRDDDPLWIFYRITNDYPNAPKMKRWIADVAALAPNVRDFGVVFAAEWRDLGYDVRAAMKSTAAKLSSMRDRADAAKKREPRPVDPLQAELQAAYRATGHYDEPYRNGSSAQVGDVLASFGGGRLAEVGQPDDGTPGSTEPSRDPGADPSAPDTAVRPASSGSPNLPDGPGESKEPT